MRQHLQLRLYSKRGRYEKNQHLSYMQSADDFRFIIFCLCGYCNTGGVTAVVTPRAVDSSGNIIDVSENINHVEHTAFAKANATTTDTTTTKPAYNQEEMKKILKTLVKKIWQLRQ